MLLRSLTRTRVTQFTFSRPSRLFSTSLRLPQARKPLSRIPLGAKNDKGGSSASKSPINSKGSIEFATWKAALLFVVIGSSVYYFFQKEKKRLEVEREAESNRGYGKPIIGGNFKLINAKDNTEFTQENLKGHWSLIYFGFTHCPDICPDELDKLSHWIDVLESKHNIKNLLPLFITCDPARDDPQTIKTYLQDFHPRIVGLTGSYDAIKDACKKFRVYFSTPPDLKPGQDYLVDHSVFFYMMDPDGNFAQVLGLNSDENTGVTNIMEHINNFVPAAERAKREDKWYSFLTK